MKARKAVIKRQTKETVINLELNLDGNGESTIDTGISNFDHLLSQVAKHGVFNINLKATGDDKHHLIEDVAICFGKALIKTLGDKANIVRMADATVPMDESLATVVIDISGRGYSVLDIPLKGNDMGGFPADLVRHFLESFAAEGKLNLHVKVLYGVNDHHKVEAVFKALGRVLHTATRINERAGLPSTKGLIE